MKKISPFVALSGAFASRTILALLLLAFILANPAHASTYTWTNGDSSVDNYWEDPGNWSPNPAASPYLGATGDVANLTGDITSVGGSGGGTVIINGSYGPVVVGTLNIGDATDATGGVAYSVQALNPGGTLTFSNSGMAFINDKSLVTGGDSMTVTINMADNLTISNSGTQAFTLSGGVTGTGNLTLNTTGSSAAGLILFSSAQINNVGSLTIAGTSAAPVNITGGIGSNVTAINQNGIGALTISGTAIFVNSAGTTISSTGTATTTIGGGIAGTGTLTLNANGTGPINITTTAALNVNNTGAIISSGTGAATITISGSGVIGSSVAGLTQNSVGTLALTNTGSNAFTGTVSVLGGTLLFAQANNLGNVSNTVLLGNTTGTANSAIENSAAITWVRNITVQSGNTGVASIGSSTTGSTIISGSITLGSSGVGHNVSLVGSTSGTVNFSGNISDTGSVTAGTAGAVTTSTTGATIELSGTNTFTGGVKLAAGNLSLNSATAIGTGTFTINGGNLNQQAASNALTTNNALILDQDFSYTGSGTLSLNLGAGAVNLGALTTNNVLTTTGTTATNVARTITVNTAGTLTIGGTISNGTNGFTNSLVKAGAGTLILSGTNLYTGTTTVNAGVLQLGGTQTGSITINAGGVLNATGDFTTVTGWLTSGDITTGSNGSIALVGNSSENISFSNYPNLMLGASSNATYSGTITTSGTTVHLGGGGATLTVTNANVVPTGDNLVIGANTLPTLLTSAAAGTSTGTVVFTGATNVTGTTTVNAGTLNLSTTSGALASSAIILNGGTTLAIDNSGGGAPSSTYTRAASVTLNGANLTVTGTNVGNSDDVITGALTINSGGSNLITVNPAATTKNTELSAGSLAITGTNSFAFVNGVNLGKAAPASNAGGGNIIFTSAPAVNNGITSTGGVNITQLNTGIIAQLVGSITGTLGTVGATPNTFVTYDSTTGLRPLAVSEYATTLTGTFATGDNLDATTALVAAAPITVNSILVSGGSLTGSFTMTDSSGAVLFSSTSTAYTLGTAGFTLEFGSAQGVVTVNAGGASIASNIDGTNGLVKLGTGALTLSGTNTYTGPTQILAGQLNIGGYTTPTGTGTIYLGDTTGSANTTVNISTANATTVANNIIVQGGNTGIATIESTTGISVYPSYTGTITLGSNGVGHNVTLWGNSTYDAVNWNGTIQDPTGLTGPAGVVTIDGAYQTTITGHNTYTGGTIIANTGSILIGSTTAFGTGTVTINGGGVGSTVGAIANNLVLNAGFSVPSGTFADTGSVTLNNTVTIAGGTSGLSFTGNITDGVAGSNDGITFNANNTSSAFNVSLGGASTFDGGVNLIATNGVGYFSAFTIGNLGNATESAIGTGTFTFSNSVGSGGVSIGNGTTSGIIGTNNAELWNGNFSYTSGNYLNMGTGAVSLGTTNIATRTITVSSANGSFETDGVISNGLSGVGLAKAGPGALVLGANETYTGTTTISAGTLQLGNGGTTGSIANSPGSSLVTATGSTVLAIDRSDSFTLNSSIIGNSGIVSGLGGFTQTGTGNLTIANAMTYSGTTTINGGGTLTLTGTGSLNGSTGTALTFNLVGGSFVYDNTGATGTDSQNMQTLSALAGDGIVTSISGTTGADTLTFSNLVARSAGATLNFVLTSTGTSTVNKIALTSIGGTLTSSGSFTNKLINVGDFYNGSNYAVYDSTNGTVRAFNYSSDVGAVLITSSGTTTLGSVAANNVLLNGSVTGQNSATINTLDITGTNTVVINSAQTLTLAGLLKTATGSSTISGGTLAIGTEGVIRADQATDILTISSTISGTALTKSGAGTLVLSGPNSYTGTTTLNAGTLDINTAAALGNGGAFVIDGGAIDNTSGTLVTTSSHALTLNNDFTFGGTNALSLGTAATTLGTSDGLARTITVTGTGGALILAGNIGNGNNLIEPTVNLVKAGIGTLVLSGTNAYTGTTTINGGTLVVAGASAPVTTMTGTFSTGSNSITGLASTSGLAVGEHISGGSIVAGATITSIVSSSSVTMSSNGTANSTNTGVTFNSYSSLGTGNNVNINNGTLLVNTATVAGSPIYVGNGTGIATLSGTGTVNGPIFTMSSGLNVAHIAPGAAPLTAGTLNVGNLGFTIGNGTNFDYDLNTAQAAGSGTNDLIAMTGGVLTFSGTTTFNFDALSALTQGGTYTLINGAGSIVGFNANNFLITGLSGTLSATFSDAGGTSIFVTFGPAGSGPATAYFTGSTSTDLINPANYVSSPTGGTISGAPAANTNVFITANATVTGSFALTPSTTNGALTINSLTLTGSGTPAASTVTIGGTNTITLNASAGQGITVQTGAGNDTINAPIALGASQTWTVTDLSNTLTVAGGVSGSFTLTKAGLGTLVLSGTSTYSGGTVIGAGTLQIGAGGSTGSIGSGAITNSGTLTFDLTSAYNLTNTISGTGTIADIGAGTLTISGSNTSTGAINISVGTLSVGSTGSLGTGAISLANNTVLQYTGSTNGTINQNITVGGAPGSIGTLNNTGSGLLTLGGTLNKNGTILDFGTGKFVVAGSITGTATNSDVYLGSSTGSATVGLTNANTYTGPTKIFNGSTLLTGTAGALPVATPSDVTLGSATDGAVTNTLDLLGTSQIVNSITASSSGTNTINQVISSSGNASTATVGGSASSSTGNLNVSYSGTTTDSFSGSLGGSGSQTNFSLTKSGTGTLALTNATGNTYTGGTLISTGTLLVSNTSGSATGSGTLNLSSGATLGGTGMINSTANNINGNVQVGPGGTTTTGSLTLTSVGTTTFTGANLTFNLNAASAGAGNELNVGGSSVAFSGALSNLTLNLVGSGSNTIANGTDYILFAGLSNGQYSGLSLSGSMNVISNLSLGFTLTGTATNGQPNSIYYAQSYLFLNNGDIEVQVVPEPGTWALMLGGLALLVIFQRARRKNS